MTFKEAIRSTFRENYATFSGRAPRSEYWFVMLLFFLLSLVGGIIIGVVAGVISSSSVDSSEFGGLYFLGILGLIVLLGVLLPILALVVRRFHDVGLSGWWYLLSIVVSYIPLVLTLSEVMEPSEALSNLTSGVASIAVLVVTVWPSNVGANKYGENPHNVIDSSTFE